MSAATFTWAGQSFTASEQGFRWQTAGGEVHEGPWTRIASVMAMTATAQVHGVNVVTWQHLSVSLDGGESFRVQSRDEECFQVAKLTLAHAAPHLTARLLGALEAGRTLTFGAVTLSADRLSVKDKSWPLDQLAGHRTTQGHWMVDVGPRQAPKLAASLRLNEIPNHFALRAALERLAPGLEYPEDGPDLGTVLRPSASSHDPRYLSGRARLMVLGGLVGAALLIAGGVLGGFELSRFAERRRVEAARAQTEAKLGRIAGIAQGLTIPDAPLSCADFPKDVDDAIFLVEVPVGVEHPHHGAPYSYRTDGAAELYPFDRSTHAVVARVGSFTKLEGAVFFELHAAVAVLGMESGTVKCSGQLSARISGSRYPASRLAEGLTSAVCPPSSRERGCESAMAGVKLLPPPAPPPEEPTPEVQVAPKPARAKTPVKWTKGQRVEVLRKGKWLSAVILQVTKKGFRVRYDGLGRKRDETVPGARLRPR